MHPSNFRVIIVGAGPTGLALANMLVAADIDMVVLERHDEVVTESGVCIMLWPHSTRSAILMRTRNVIDANERLMSNDAAGRIIMKMYVLTMYKTPT
jgi:2-polyprenyl-6-methoxyphenol hydroxylase-like FAD-dependent oxidoreductase